MKDNSLIKCSLQLAGNNIQSAVSAVTSVLYFITSMHGKGSLKRALFVVLHGFGISLQF